MTKSLEPGIPLPEFNGMTTDQFRVLVAGVESQLAVMCQGKTGMYVVLLVELLARIVLDADELDPPQGGDKFVAELHTGFDDTVRGFRQWAAEAKLLRDTVTAPEKGQMN